MLKKKILGIAVIGLTAIGFTYGVFDSQGYYFYADTNSYNTNGNYGYTVSNKGNLTTTFGEADKKVFYWNFGYDNLVKTVLAWYDNKLYFMGGAYSDIKTQGYLQNFCVKEKSTRTESLHENCSYDTPINTIIEANPTFTEYAFAVIGNSTPTRGYGSTPLQFCLSDGTLDYCISCSAYYQNTTNEGTGPCASGLTGTLNITATDYETITNFNRGNSPIAGGGSNNGTGENQENTITQYACPTIQQLINTYGSDYTENLCYSSSLIYSGGTIQQITPKTIFELYPTYTGFTADISTYNTYCRAPNTTQACQTAFNGKDIEYTLLAKIPDNVKKLNLYQYCNLQLNYPDKNATTCTTNTGTIPGLDNPNITINDIITEIGNEDYTVITPGTPPEATGTGNGSGSVYDGLLGDNEDDTERWNIIENAKNIVQTMKELYAKFTGIFRAREGTSGFIPEYITGILLLIILFKLFKK